MCLRFIYYKYIYYGNVRVYGKNNKLIGFEKYTYIILL